MKMNCTYAGAEDRKTFQKRLLWCCCSLAWGRDWGWKCYHLFHQDSWISTAGVKVFIDVSPFLSLSPHTIQWHLHTSNTAFLLSSPLLCWSLDAWSILFMAFLWNIHCFNQMFLLKSVKYFKPEWNPLEAFKWWCGSMLPVWVRYRCNTCYLGAQQNLRMWDTITGPWHELRDPWHWHWHWGGEGNAIHIQG